jgi:hypothetical protein
VEKRFSNVRQHLRGLDADWSKILRTGHVTLARTNQILRAWSCDQAKAKITQHFIHTKTSQLFRPVLDFQKLIFLEIP